MPWSPLWRRSRLPGEVSQLTVPGAFSGRRPPRCWQSAPWGGRTPWPCHCSQWMSMTEKGCYHCCNRERAMVSLTHLNSSLCSMLVLSSVLHLSSVVYGCVEICFTEIFQNHCQFSRGKDVKLSRAHPPTLSPLFPSQLWPQRERIPSPLLFGNKWANRERIWMGLGKN